jgi:hypothetical protein
MGDQSTGGVQNFNDQYIKSVTAPTSQQAPPPPGPPSLVPGGVTPAPGAPPPDYSALGTGQAKADFASASATGGWEFDPEAMDKVIQSLDDSLDHDFRQAQTEARWLTQIAPPGDEVGSHGYTKAANKSGASYQEFLKGAVDYTGAYVDTLKQIRTAYQNQDHAALDALRGIGKAV